MQSLVRTILAAIMAAFITGVAIAQEGFDPLVVDDLSAPKTVKKIKDPTGKAPSKTVYSFKLPQGYCNPKRYDPSSDDSDCKWKSTRSQYRENVFATKKNGTAQPKESWYGFHVFFPEDFPYGFKQTKGHYEFAYWHNHQCPHMTFSNLAGQEDVLQLEFNRALGNYECEPRTKLPVAKFKDLVGKWSKFEVFVRWANDANGQATIYLNGSQVQDYKGPTLVVGLEKINYFKFGIYLCCTQDVKQIREANVLFANVSRAPAREGLAGNK